MKFIFFFCRYLLLAILIKSTIYNAVAKNEFITLVTFLITKKYIAYNTLHIEIDSHIKHHPDSIVESFQRSTNKEKNKHLVDQKIQFFNSAKPDWGKNYQAGEDMCKEINNLLMSRFKESLSDIFKPSLASSNDSKKINTSIKFQKFLSSEQDRAIKTKTKTKTKIKNYIKKRNNFLNSQKIFLKQRFLYTKGHLE